MDGDDLLRRWLNLKEKGEKGSEQNFETDEACPTDLCCMIPQTLPVDRDALPEATALEGIKIGREGTGRSGPECQSAQKTAASEIIEQLPVHVSLYWSMLVLIE